ncbi:hypothetical protein [Hymenobacter cavernae]|uniref:Uncharacterized protein n=1 Tax=Hymenobacter cavernae TaxID=2044852 RepID=A0ABQ1UXL8_9BACT|nr:hypothetical protein [Hymenobacter cavernae]GGF28290.1 hypothetical protein GCM10011383_45050 [Hymenobacter cavernae]
MINRVKGWLRVRKGSERSFVIRRRKNQREKERFDWLSFVGKSAKPLLGKEVERKAHLFDKVARVLSPLHDYY